VKTILIAVVTLDGCITRHDQPGAQGWASKEDQDHFRKATAACDVRVFGSGTYLPDRESFLRSIRPGVRKVVLTSQPKRFEADAVAGQLEFTSETPNELVARLTREGHQRCAVLGGGGIYGAFLRSGLIDEIELTVEPLVFGSGTRLAGDQPLEQQFRLVSVEKLNESSLLIKYVRL
jgi:dihydrofolate reductase